MSERDPNDVVRLTTANNPAYAHILEQALLAEGIEARVVGDYLEAGVGDIGGVQPEVWVHRDELERAEEILRQGEKAAMNHLDEAEEEEEVAG